MPKRVNEMRVAIRYVNATNALKTRDDEGNWSSFEVTVSCPGGAETVRGLTWDEMLGHVASVYPAPRRPLFRPSLRRELAEVHDEHRDQGPADTSGPTSDSESNQK